MAGPKRPADNDTPDITAKKPRFDARNPSTLAPDAPEDDLILDADVIGNPGAQPKRNAVKIDGYESDSDSDNFDARAAERGKNGGAGSKDEEEDDMFADLEQADGDRDEEKEGKGRKKKDVRFLDPGEVEGEVMSSRSGGHVSNELLLGKGKGRVQGEEGESSGEEDEEGRAEVDGEMEAELATEVGAGGKKKHAPRLDAFNLQEEEEEGRYDEAGNYVRKAVDPDAVNDNWLDGLSKKDIRRAKEAQEKRDDQQRRKAAADDALLTSDLLSTLVSHLETGETPLECLQRLNKGKRATPKVAKWKKQKNQPSAMDVDEVEDPTEKARRQALEAVTGAADALYGRQQHDIYDTEREMLLRDYRRETGEDWRPAEAENGEEMWEYRWSDSSECHGPYDGPTMKAWEGAGYFGDGVEFRRVGSEEWSRLLDVR